MFATFYEPLRKVGESKIRYVRKRSPLSVIPPLRFVMDLYPFRENKIAVEAKLNVKIDLNK